MKKPILLILAALFILSGCSFSQSPNNEAPLKLRSDIIAESANEVPPEAPAIIKPIIIAPVILNIPADKKFFNKRLPVLMFHYIKDVPPNTYDQLGYRLSFSPKKFEELLVFLKENNIQTLTFWDLKDIIEGKKESPKKSVMLTFDDGYIDHYTNAFQLLKKYNMKGVFYIISGKPDQNSNYANWDQIKEMADSGQEIGSHTILHPNLAFLSKDEIKEQLETSKKAIEEKIGKAVISFCYPSGRYDERAIKAAKASYLFARTTNSGEYFYINKRYEIPVIRIFPTTNIATLKALFE